MPKNETRQKQPRKRTPNRSLFRAPDGWPEPSDDLIPVMQEHAGETLLLSFSMGKDSLAMWLYLREHFRIIPYFLYWMPGLSFQERALDYYEEFFGCHIMRLPHPLLIQWLDNGLYMPPNLWAYMYKQELVRYELSDVDDALALSLGLDRPYTALGFRRADNLDRRRLIQQLGAVAPVDGKRRYYYAIWDWDIERVAGIINRNGVKLPDDYQYWGRTIAALRYQFLAPLKRHAPDDYARFLDWFPLLEAEFYRWEVLNPKYAQADTQ
jgi:hypothetical protein